MTPDSFLLPFDLATWQIVIGIAIFFVLMFQRWFWFVLFAMISFNAGIQALLNLGHFNLTYLFGYSILAFVCWSNAVAIGKWFSQPLNEISDHSPLTKENIHPDWSPH